MQESSSQSKLLVPERIGALCDRNGQTCTFSTKTIAEGMDGAEAPCDTAWLARLLAMPEPPTPPSRQKRGGAAKGGSMPDLFCNEVLPSTTSWPPLLNQWPYQSPNPPEGTPLPEQFHSTLATRSPLPSARDPTRVVGMPVKVERASQHARTCRLSEMEKLMARVDKLERTLSELSARIEATARKRPAQEVHQTGSGGNVGSIDQCSSNISFGEGSTMNNYLLDRLIDECWPGKPS